MQFRRKEQFRRRGWADLDSLPVTSRNPLRRLADQVVLTSMRPPILPTLLQYGSNREVIDLKGKRILLTGASSGIGEAAAEKLARRGATVVAVARRQDLLDAVVARITEAGGPTSQARPTPATCPTSTPSTTSSRGGGRLGGVDILINNAGRSIRRPLAESLDRWHDVERTMTLNYYSPLRLIRGLAPGMLERGDGHIINVPPGGDDRVPPLFSRLQRVQGGAVAVSRVIETEWAPKGVHSTTLYYPLVNTPMIAPTRAYDGLPGLTADEAADWMITAARTRPVSIAPRIAVTAHAINSVAPGAVDSIMKRQRMQPKDR